MSPNQPLAACVSRRICAASTAALALGAASAALPQERFVECARVIYSIPREPDVHIGGRRLARVPDVDGDGIAELVIGRPGATAEGGSVRLVDGRTGIEVFRVLGAAADPTTGTAGDGLGEAVAPAGDYDGDGVGDLLVSAYRAGAVRVLSGVDGRTLFEMSGAAGAFGGAIAAVKDVDADGSLDFAVTEISSANLRGIVHVLSGADGSELRVLQGVGAFDCFGSELAALDWNNDGRGELAVAAPRIGFGRVLLFDLRTGAELAQLTPPMYSSFHGVSTLRNTKERSTVDRNGLLIHQGGGAVVFDVSTSTVLSQVRCASNEGVDHVLPLDDLDGDRVSDYAMTVHANPRFSGAALPRVELRSGRTGLLLRQITLTSWLGEFGDLVAGPDLDGDGAGEILLSYFHSGTPDWVDADAFHAVASRVPVQQISGDWPGTAAVAPQLSITGCPRLGGTMRFETERVVGGALGALVLGGALTRPPIASGVLLPRPDVRIYHRASGPRGLGGSGDASLSVTLPGDAALAGTTFYAQAAYIDRAAFGGFSLTPTLGFTLY